MKIRRKHIQMAGWALIPTLIIFGLIEYTLREDSSTTAHVRLVQKGVYKEKQVIEDLVQGCAVQEEIKWLPPYLSERLFGKCRSLAQASLNGARLRYAHLRYAHLHDARLRDAVLFHADLNDAILSDADLSDAILSEATLSDANLLYANLSLTDLYQANLSHADLSHAVLSSTNLSDADLSHASLSHADLSNANLFHADLSHAALHYAILFHTDLRDTLFSNVVLSNAILLNTDFRSTQELSQKQLEGDASPLICNSPLPESIEININRDCDKLAIILIERYPGRFANIDQAEEFVNKQRQKQWE